MSNTTNVTTTPTPPPATTTLAATTTTTQSAAPITTVTTRLIVNHTNMTNSTGEQNQWEFLLSAFFIMLVGTGICAVIIMCCKRHTKEKRRKREERERKKEEAKKAMEEELKAIKDENERLQQEREEQIRRELEEQEEIELARKENREVDPVYNRDDVFYATVGEVPVVVEHPSSMVETGAASLDHKGAPKPRSGDVRLSQAKSSDVETGMVHEKLKAPPVVMGMKVISGVDFYRNQYEKTVAQQEARAAANAADQARQNAQPFSYRKKPKRDTVGLGEDFASAMDGGRGDGPVSAVSELPWIGKQNLSAFDQDAFEKAFAELPDDDEQEEIEKRKLASAADPSASISAKVTGQVLAEGIGASRTSGGGGASKMSLMEAPGSRAAREAAEALARRNDMIEKKKYEKALEQSKKPQKKGQAKNVLVPEPPKLQQRVVVVAEHLKKEKDKEAYYASIL